MNSGVNKNELRNNSSPEVLYSLFRNEEHKRYSREEGFGEKQVLSRRLHPELAILTAKKKESLKYLEKAKRPSVP